MGHLTGVKFAYGVARNLGLLKPEVESLEKALQGSEDFQKFEKKRIALAEQFAEKDEKGKPLTENNQYVMKDHSGFEAEYEKLKEENKDLVAKREEELRVYAKLLEEDSVVELYKISLADVPQNITTAQMFVLTPILSE